jgi:uncharacterized protein (DUF302 family)
MTELGMRKVLKAGYDQALIDVPAALKTEGFGVLTEIDIRDTFNKKLGVDFRRYKILGACNPHLAHQALSHNLSVGVMLPCNVVVYEADSGQVTIEVIDPLKTIAALGDSSLALLAQTVREKLERVLAQLH